MAAKSVPEKFTALQSQVQTFTTEALLAVALNDPDIREAARAELMARGIGPDGKWHAPDALREEWSKIEL